ncbi:tRNA lysidine(34) synthetase TilS [Sulfitobacter sp. S190]|uniref:tRNA lysidine(34) synthetase TilS n=1 Tax=Sulfitobacter sp. S190 TaxID=2867022 RepID=UPI0021A8BD2C|nr:tRNA lysidine(34) synthetase TilS [Sulfitobacter sp. S190]UWR23384.1 tRNA lysidine(34) synthetase TilS [Sulfitobacter sp. S190]
MAAFDAVTGSVRATVAHALAPSLPGRLGVAVSGGGDSIALLTLLHEIATTQGAEIAAVTVDHRLRDGSADEARGVAEHCARLGVAHDTVCWTEWDGRGNLQDRAREARVALISQWARTRGIAHVALGHTQDDQAETVLLRLGRRAGVGGLAAMRPRSHRDGITWLRPLLGVSRAALREYLRGKGVSWVEDPSNDDLRFDRIRVRHALGSLGEIGIDAAALAAVADNLADADAALADQARACLDACGAVQLGSVRFDWEEFHRHPHEIRRRVLSAAVQWHSGRAYGPRRAGLAQVMAAVEAKSGGTVDGCHILTRAGAIWVLREHRRIADAHAAPGSDWDMRWRCDVANGLGRGTNARVAVLGGKGLKVMVDWRASGLPWGVARSLPALWQGDEVVSVPALLPHKDVQWCALRDEKALRALLLSH